MGNHPIDDKVSILHIGSAKCSVHQTAYNEHTVDRRPAFSETSGGGFIAWACMEWKAAVTASSW